MTDRGSEQLKRYINHEMIEVLICKFCNFYGTSFLFPLRVDCVSYCWCSGKDETLDDKIKIGAGS